MLNAFTYIAFTSQSLSGKSSTHGLHNKRMSWQGNCGKKTAEPKPSEHDHDAPIPKGQESPHAGKEMMLH